MDTEYISETDFLITELRYTLGQLHVQVLDLDPTTRGECHASGRSIDQILQDMIEQEAAYQQRFATLLHGSAPTGNAADESIPLPVNASEETPSLESTFEHRRAQTIHMLEAATDSWPPELIDAVKEQVAHDRQAATDIAECRMNFLQQPSRPDLAEPLAPPH